MSSDQGSSTENLARKYSLQFDELGEVDGQAQYGIVVPEGDLNPDILISPPKLEEAGFIARFNPESGDLDLNVVDAILAFTMRDTRCILEVPAEEDIKDLRGLVSVAINMNIDISLLPPQSPDDTAIDTWITRVCDFQTEYLTRSNIQTHIYPASSYIEYVIMRELGHETPDHFDEYIAERFIKQLSEEAIDRLKDRQERALQDMLGGPEGVHQFVMTVCQAVGQRAKDMLKEVVSNEQSRAEQGANKEGEEEEGERTVASASENSGTGDDT